MAGRARQRSSHQRQGNPQLRASFHRGSLSASRQRIEDRSRRICERVTEANKPSASQDAAPEKRSPGRLHLTTFASGADHVSLAHHGNTGGAHRPHRHLELGVENIERAVDTLLPKSGEPPDVRTPNSDGIGA